MPSDIWMVQNFAILAAQNFKNNFIKKISPNSTINKLIKNENSNTIKKS